MGSHWFGANPRHVSVRDQTTFGIGLDLAPSESRYEGSASHPNQLRRFKSQSQATIKSSSAGFRSKVNYGSGFFHVKMKLSNKKTEGILTSYYLTSASSATVSTMEQKLALGNHFELDFEFFGTNGKLNTNIFNDDDGHREQTFKLWFDPSQDYHIYDILWNPLHIVFFVDNIPIREFKNLTAQGLPTYPSKAMCIDGSLWNAESWAGKVNWTLAPFMSYYSDFGFNGCIASRDNNVVECASERYSWNQSKNWELTPMQKQQMKEYRAKYMTYDYCAYDSIDPQRKRECSLNNV